MIIMLLIHMPHHNLLDGVKKLKKQPIHPAFRKCMQHLDIIHANDKTKQIVYMYMKVMDEEIAELKKQMNKELPQKP